MNVVEQSQNFCLNYLSYLRKVANYFEISQSQAICLNLIPTQGISQSDLAKKLSLDISTLSRNLNHLIKLNLINKQVSNVDKRSYRINLSAKGMQFYKLFNEEIQSRLQKIYNGISLDEIEQLTEILNKVNWQFELHEK
jgi:DNA-binding MarR family transcriptional regulator